MQNSTRKNLFYAFILVNIIGLIYIYTRGSFIDFEALKSFLTGKNFFISYLIYILILIIRGLTLTPGTAFLLVGIYLFSVWQVFLAIQIAIICYCLIIYNFSHKLNFKIPDKILSYEGRIKRKEIPIIFSLCFIPGISINVLVYFLSIIGIQLRKILIGVIAGTFITSPFYILLLKGAFVSGDYFANLWGFFGG